MNIFFLSELIIANYGMSRCHTGKDGGENENVGDGAFMPSGWCFGGYLSDGYAYADPHFDAEGCEDARIYLYAHSHADSYPDSDGD